MLSVKTNVLEGKEVIQDRPDPVCIIQFYWEPDSLYGTRMEWNLVKFIETNFMFHQFHFLSSKVIYHTQTFAVCTFVYTYNQRGYMFTIKWEFLQIHKNINGSFLTIFQNMVRMLFKFWKHCCPKS